MAVPFAALKSQMDPGPARFARPLRRMGGWPKWVGALQAAEKDRIPRNIREQHTSEPKGPVDFAGFMTGLTSRPAAGYSD